MGNNQNNQKMKFWSIVLLTINGIIGTGIFLSPGAVAKLVGDKAAMIYLAAAAFAAVLAVSFAAASKYVVKSGAAYAYSKAAFGDEVGSYVGITRVVSASIAWGVMATGVVTVGDTKYTFSDTGEIQKQERLEWGWVQKNGQRYFLNRRQEQVGGSDAKKVIDVSEHNGKIQNWSSVIRENGIDGVIVRLGYYAYDEDKQLAYNIKELNRLGIPYGVYLYTYAENETDAELEAKHTIKLMEKYHIKPTYPIYYDVENWEYVNKTKAAPKDTKTWVKIVNKYMETMHKAGYTNVRIYSYRHLLQTRLNHPDILQHVNWVAAYTDALDWNNPHYSGEKGWQYTSSEYLKGIRGRVDVSVWY